MSLASVYPASEVHSSHSSLSTLSQSLDDIQSWSATASVTTTATGTTTTTNTHYPPQQQQQQEPVLTIEQLRAQLSSCFTCGVCWADQHVSLDCSECGGYALQRPCADCEGQCGELWRRDFTLSHESSKAKWQGVCKRANPAPAPVNEPAAQEQLCSRLEKLTAKTSAT